MSDEALLLGLMAAFYREERLAYAEAVARTGLRELFTRPELGRVFILRGDEESRARGHLVLTFGFSLEFRGRFVLLDELFVDDGARGRGYGVEAIELAARWAKAQGAAALRLEVNRANRHGREIYLRREFKNEERDLLTRWL